MRVGVIGSGRIGSTVAGLAAAAGHDVAIANTRGPESLAGLAAELGVRAETVAGAAAHGELVLVAVPVKAYDELPAAELPARSCSTPATTTRTATGGSRRSTTTRSTSTELLAALLPDAHVVKAFNTLYWEHLRDRGGPDADEPRLVVFLAGDDAPPRARGRAFIRDLGFVRGRDGRPGRRRPPAADRRPALGRPGHRGGGRRAPRVTGIPFAMARAIRRTELNECRQCSTFCDRVIRPATCVAAGCPALYQYDDPLSGRRYMGCLHKVFATEIDVALFEAAERTRAGYGAVKLAGAPLRRCAFQVEQAFDWRDADRRLHEPPLLRLAGRRGRRDPGLRSARRARG